MTFQPGFRADVRVEMAFPQTPSLQCFSVFYGYGLSRFPAYHNFGAGGGGHA